MALRVLSSLQFGSYSQNYWRLTKRFLAKSSKDVKQVDATIVSVSKDIKDALLLDDQKLALEARKDATLIVSDFENVGCCSGVPAEQINTRTVRIYCPAKSAMQSGTNNINYWQIDFETQERWENPLMGWTSTADPLSNLQVAFATEDEAIEYCNKMGWHYYIQKPNAYKPKPRSYGTNFSWNKRTRVSTK